MSCARRTGSRALPSMTAALAPLRRSGFPRKKTRLDPMPPTVSSENRFQDFFVIPQYFAHAFPVGTRLNRRLCTTWLASLLQCNWLTTTSANAQPCSEDLQAGTFRLYRPVLDAAHVLHRMYCMITLSRLPGTKGRPAQKNRRKWAIATTMFAKAAARYASRKRQKRPRPHYRQNAEPKGTPQGGIKQLYAMCLPTMVSVEASGYWRYLCVICVVVVIVTVR